MRRVRGCFLINIAVAQSVVAASVAMAGVILILLLGSQLLDWYWPALLAVVTFPLAFYRTARRLPSSYRVAQIVDERLELRDALSTALYFHKPPESREFSESMRQAQLAESERIARQVDPKAAVPLAAPRAMFLFGVLFLAAAALFTLRYMVESRMDLKKPLSRLLFDAWGGSFDQHAAAKKKQGSKKPWEQVPAGVSVEDHDAQDPGKLDNAPPTALDTIEDPDANNEGVKSTPGSKSKGKSDGTQAEGERPGDEAEQSESAQGSAASKDADQSGAKQGDASAGKQANSSGENSSLASKIKDAMQNLMASLRPQNGGQNPQPQPGQNGAQKSQQEKGEKGSAGQAQKKGSEQSADTQDGQSSDDSDSGKSAEGKSNGKSSDQQASHNPGSGIGRQDGAKDARLAEQLAAMGKISEIIGKRSANVTGEVTVEVNSSKQQLRTQYSDSKATHKEAGSEINRDEVPAAFQQYVQQYFEQVRKQAAPAKSGGKGGTTAPAQPETPQVPGPVGSAPPPTQ
jgi:hypothetical protein